MSGPHRVRIPFPAGPPLTGVTAGVSGSFFQPIFRGDWPVPHGSDPGD
jgi:hypothetical protein